MHIAGTVGSIDSDFCGTDMTIGVDGGDPITADEVKQVIVDKLQHDWYKKRCSWSCTTWFMECVRRTKAVAEIMADKNWHLTVQLRGKYVNFICLKLFNRKIYFSSLSSSQEKI